MDLPPPPPPGRRASAVVERKLDELCACLDDALSSRPRRPYAEARLAAEIKAKTDFLRSLLAAEAECRGGGALPEPLAEAEARFAVLEATFEQWARRAAAAPEPEEKGVGEEEAGRSGSSGSTCSCTHSCQEAAAGDAVVEARKEATADGVAGEGHDADEREAAAEPMGRTVQQRWWRRSAAWCGAAGVVAVVAVGLAVEFAAVAHHNVSVYVVPT